MPSIGPGCHELRIIDETVTWRIIYAVDSEAIAVLEVFAKKSNQTPKGILSNCSRRLRAFKQTVREADHENG